MNSSLKRRLLLVRWWIFNLNRRQLRRWQYEIVRPPSYPYISGDGLRRLARRVFDETHRRLNPASVGDGDVIFVSTHYAPRFFSEIDPGIRGRYRLITHNGDAPADATLISMITDKVELWFAQNCTFQHERVVPIPIGLENLRYYKAGIPQQYDELRDYPGPRANRILFGFSMTHPVERAAALEFALRAPYAESLPKRLDQGEYLRTLRTYKFVLSPPGNGMDAHRTWEAMYLGVVPIVKDSHAMRAFQGLGLPLWVVQDWDVLLSISEGELESKYEERRKGFDCPALYMDYWHNLILGKDTTKVESEAGSKRREAQA